MIEIVVVIAILGVVSAIAVPKLSGFSEKAKIKSDGASLEVLNRSTKLYGATNNINSEDVFEGITKNDNDELGIGLLVEDGLLEEVVKAQEKGKRFEWDIDGQTWKIGNLDSSADSDSDPVDPDLEEGITKDEAEAAGFKLELNKDGTYSVVGYDPEIGGTDPEVPETIGGVAVTSIADDAFMSKGLTSVIISDTIKSIGKFAFYDNNLSKSKLVIPDSVEIIGEYAFHESKITSVKLPKELKKIENGVFSRNKLTSVTIPDTVTSIGDFAFDLNKLSEVTIPAGVKNIGEHGFFGNNLKRVTIEGSNTKIESEAFSKNILSTGDVYNIKSNDNKGTWIPGGSLGLLNWVKIK